MMVRCLKPYKISHKKSGTTVNKDELSACGAIHSRSPTDIHGQPQGGQSETVTYQDEFIIFPNTSESVGSPITPYLVEC
jgi:hypothetical protein